MTSGPFRLVQISDLHLPAMPQTHYRDRDVSNQLQRVLTHLKQHHGKSDLLLVTGDNVHQGQLADYRALKARLDATGMNWCWIPGNHDDAPAMAALWSWGSARTVIPGWQLLLLDSTANPDGRGSGALTPASKQRLVAAQQDPRPALIVLHHNPMAVGSAWQDAIGLQGSEQFWQQAAALHPASLVVCGHLHQVWDRSDTPLRVLSCPATSVQFRPRCPQLQLEQDGAAALPGYRWLTLSKEGEVATGVERVCLA